MVHDVTNVDPWRFDLEGYIRDASPDAVGRADAWQTAIGLQAVDGLPVSDYLLETSREHIEGNIDINEAERRIVDYYHTREQRHETVEETKEGDVVSSRIARLLGERAFVFSPLQLNSIHRALFEGLLAEAGEYRTYNITKREWVLGGDTVLYAPANLIAETLEYDFSREREFNHKGVGHQALVRRVASFISGVWQIHPFCEGNTRTTAVFTIKYLATLGQQTDNEPFKRHSWYFRNALVRANYEDVEREIFPTRRYLDLFFDNLLLGTGHELKNRYLHIDWPDSTTQVSATPQGTPQGTPQVDALLSVLGEEELSTVELMQRLSLRDRKHFRKAYLLPALAMGVIELTIPDKPTSMHQKYRCVR